MAISSIPISPKLPSRRTKNEFYRYYAGYPMEFAKWALGELELDDGSMIIDPWNGSGTTAAACAHLGMSCQGYDINPVMVHLGRARVASEIDFVEARDVIDAVEEIAGYAPIVSVKSIGAAFQELPVGNESAHSIAIAALFPFARDLLTLSKSKNPSWFKKDASLDDINLEKDELFKSWKSLLDQVSLWRSAQSDFEGVTVSVERGDSRKSLGKRNAFDGILTSPPYLTRLDYIQATLPEFLLLKEFDAVPNMQRLRRSMLGSPLTSERPEKSVDRLPKEIQDLLDRIRRHSSKASASYYYRFFSTYFIDLQASIRNISNVLKSGAKGCLVVQSSHYKEIEVNLARAVVLIGEDFGLYHHRTFEFGTRRSMSLINTRAHQDARAPKSESAVFFRKD